MMFSFIFVVVFISAFGDEAMAGVCPPPGEIAPCSCTDLGSEGLVIQLNCFKTQLDDEMASQILDKMISWPRVSPLRRLDLSSNRLTRIPTQLTKFPMLNYIELGGNQIASIEAKAFNLETTFTSLNLNSNPIASVEEGAFQGYYGDTTVNLQSISLTRFEADVFQSMLEQIEPYDPTGRAYVDIHNNQIDCISDPCHMAWLILFHRQLLKVVRNGQCSNGPSFSTLNRNDYLNCTFTCPSTTLNKGGNYSDPKSCTNYYSCDGGIAHLRSCPIIRNTTEQLIFDPLTKKCDKAAKTPGCSVRPFFCPSPDPRYSYNNVNSENYANPNSPHSYYRCINDVPYLVDCGLLVFNWNSKQCDITA